jgi:phosphohistidine phosphatase
MKTLYIVRHAKSSWDHPGLEDYQRPLLEKGKKRTKYVVDYLLENETKPGLIISSHAVRAHETAKIIANAFNYPENKIVISKNLYFCDLDSCYNLFFDLADDIDSLMIVGHNPVFTYFANEFLKKPIDNLPTSGIVCIEFKTNKWEEIVNAKYKAKFVISPRSLRESGKRY